MADTEHCRTCLDYWTTRGPVLVEYAAEHALTPDWADIRRRLHRRHAVYLLPLR